MYTTNMYVVNCVPYKNFPPCDKNFTEFHCVINLRHISTSTLSTTPPSDVNLTSSGFGGLWLQVRPSAGAASDGHGCSQQDSKIGRRRRTTREDIFAPEAGPEVTAGEDEDGEGGGRGRTPFAYFLFFALGTVPLPNFVPAARDC